MKKLVTVMVVLASGAMAFAEGATNAFDTAAGKSERRERMLRASGGIIQQEAVGKIVIVNGQDKIPQNAIDACIADLKKVLRVTIETSTQNMNSPFEIGAVRLPADAQMAVYVVNDAKLPMSLVAVEAGWGLVNVANLREGRRFTAEFYRVATLTLGGGISQSKGGYMQTVRSTGDLDKIIDLKFRFDSVVAMCNNLRAVGVTAPRKVSYKVACQEGWAPPPTNDYQKAIWDKVHAPPANPMKIEFDPKKGR